MGGAAAGQSPLTAAPRCSALLCSGSRTCPGGCQPRPEEPPLAPSRPEDGAAASGGAGCPMAQDVDLKACQEALDGCCPHQGDGQLELQKEEDINQSNHNHVDSLLSLESYLQLLSSQMENMLEVRLLEDIQVATPNRGQDPSSSHHNISLTQTLHHCFSPHDAMLLRTDYSTQTSSETRHLQRQESFSQSSYSITNPESVHGSNLAVLLSAADIRNLMAHDDNFDEIKLMSLALENGFNTIEVSQQCEEPGSDSGLSLNPSHSTVSYLVSSEGAVEYSNGVKFASSLGLGTVGGHCQEHANYGHVEYPADAECSTETTLQQQFLQNHTYSQLPSQAAPAPVHHQQMWMKKPNEVKDRCYNSTDTKLTSDEYRANALRLPFSVDEIVSMPVDSFSAMITKNHLTDTQVSLLRDIRRRGKNRVAAQNCRKRKMNAILNLEEDVCNLQTQKERLKKEHSQCSRSISQMKQKLNNLYHDIFSRMKDDQGRPFNPRQYIIHCSSDGSVFLIPKQPAKSEQKHSNEKEQKQKDG